MLPKCGASPLAPLHAHRTCVRQLSRYRPFIVSVFPIQPSLLIMIITALSPGVAILNGAPFATRWHASNLPRATGHVRHACLMTQLLWEIDVIIGGDCCVLPLQLSFVRL